jgi:hypothetical protein
VGPVPALRKVHGGVTRAGEVVGDQKAFEVHRILWYLGSRSS